MHNKGITIAIVLFVLIIIGMFVFAYIKRTEVAQQQPAPQQATSTVAGPYDSITRVDAKHFYINGVHTIAGEMLMPTPCDLLNWSTTTTDTTHLVAEFTVVNHAETCAQTVTAERFMMSWTAPQNATISATLMGRQIQLNLIPAANGETPEQFELFMKG